MKALAGEPSVMYREIAPTKRWSLLLVLVFSVLYLGDLWYRPLSEAEALQATVAWEMQTGGNWFGPMLHGRPFDTFPLYPWLINLCSLFQRPSALSARLPAVLSILGMAGTAGYFAARAVGHLGGALAAGMVLASIPAFRVGTVADEEAVVAFLIGLAWLSWYRLGRIARRWNLAWICSHLLVAAASFATGVEALVMFYFPLFFLRRPLRAAPRMRLPGFSAGLVLYVLVILAWGRLAPGRVLFPWSVAVAAGENGGGVYPWRLVWFPLLCALYLLPWSSMAWAGFCVAFRPVERTPVLCKFLRTLVCSNFIFCWLFPGIGVLALFRTLLPLAVLTGIEYEILVRRYHRNLVRVPWALAVASAVLGSGIVVLLGLHLCRVVVFEPLVWSVWFRILVWSCVAVGLSLWIVRRGLSTGPVWLGFVLATAAIRFLYLAVAPTAVAALGPDPRIQGAALAQNIPPDHVVYRYGVPALSACTFYLGRPVIELRGPADLPQPDDVPVLYVLGGVQAPLLDLENRRWEACSAPVRLRSDPSLRLVREPGDGALFRLVLRERVVAGAGSVVEPTLRVYRGRLRPAEERRSRATGSSAAGDSGGERETAAERP
jgi:4-amino-4-deoxy-L-arabinose transferase-like glycosyltransferase